jgi:LmbE family N-acetylglucosaminyl deacetylase
MSTHVMTIFAHPDDAECVAGGTLLKWAAEGARITMCILTDGDKGTNDADEAKATVVARRREEQARAAERLGADVIYLGYEDGYLQPTLDLRRDLVRVLRRARPDRVVTTDPTVWFRREFYINHPDHRAAGQCALEALYPAVKKPGIFPELLAEGLEPHVVHEVWLGPPNEANVWVDIGPFMDAKLDLICRHASQFPPEPTREVFTRMARDAGAERGLAHAESFRRLFLARRTVNVMMQRNESADVV